MQPYVYTPIDPTTDAIRLVRLHKRLESGFICCDIVEVLLHEVEGIPYEALSYTWGANDKAKIIILDKSRSLRVSSNLHAALLNIKLEEQDRLLWIDAICINQNDDRERGHQVRQMGRIYQHAENILIWLGKIYPEVDPLADVMIELNERAMKRYSFRKDSTEAWYEAWHEIESDFVNRVANLAYRNTMTSILQHPWFQRVWILQEIANARTAYVIFGRKSVPTRAFAIMPLLLELKVDNLLQPVLDIMPGVMRATSWWSHQRDLQTLLKRFGGSRATDPRDKIYALLGISSDVYDDTSLQPDYTISVERVIQRTMSFLMFGAVLDNCEHLFPRCSMTEFLASLDELPQFTFNWIMEQVFLYQCDQRGLFFQACCTSYTSGQPSSSFKALCLPTDYNRDTPVASEAKEKKSISRDIDHAVCQQPKFKKYSVTFFYLLLAFETLDINVGGKWGLYPIEMAVLSGRYQLLEAFLAHPKVDVNCRGNTGDTLLTFAARIGRPDIVELLLLRGDIDVNRPKLFPVRDLALGQEASKRAPDYRIKDTPLHIAVRYRDIQSIKLLLAHQSIDENIPNSINQTPLSLATALGHGFIATLLSKYRNVRTQSRLDAGEA